MTVAALDRRSPPPMRFAYAGIDFLADVFDALVGSGWTPVKLFSRPCDGVHDVNEGTVAAAAGRGLPVQLSRMKERDLRDLSERGCDVLVVAGYPWRIPPIEEYVPFGFNFHPSPLPRARGPYPLFQAILTGEREWGVTAHLLAEDFDTGDILAQDLFPVSEGETHDTLLAKCQVASGRIARAIAGDLHGHMERAAPQGPGSYWGRTSDEDRTLDFTAGIQNCLLKIRAFGSIETIAHVGGTTVYVGEASAWRESHSHQPGAIVHSYRRHLMVAALDGYVLLTRWSPIPLATASKTGR
jgi:methionyl-tRNA formyltransferase